MFDWIQLIPDNQETVAAIYINIGMSPNLTTINCFESYLWFLADIVLPTSDKYSKREEEKNWDKF